MIHKGHCQQTSIKWKIGSTKNVYTIIFKWQVPRILFAWWIENIFSFKKQILSSTLHFKSVKRFQIDLIDYNSL